MKKVLAFISCHVLYCCQQEKGHPKMGERDMVGYKVDPFKKDAELVEVNGLDDYYREIGCDCIDIAVVSVHGMPFNVIVDDEGLLKGGAVPSVFDGVGRPRLVNVAIVLGFDDDCDVRSLTASEVSLLSEETYVVSSTYVGDWLALITD